MSNQADGQAIRRVLLEVIKENAEHLQTGSVLHSASERLRNEYGSFSGQALLTLFYDLFRMGHLSWGYNLSNPDPPFCHLTEQGRRTLQHLSRDPANPDGYLAHLAKAGALHPVADSYIREALDTYNANCFKASAVMVGAAAEATVLELRDVLVKRIQGLNRSPPKDMLDWRIKRVLDALKKDLDLQKGNMPTKLAESLDAYWPAFTQQIRAVRNEAGHPTSVAPITADTVHAALLVFPELVRLRSSLSTWISQSYR